MFRVRLCAYTRHLTITLQAVFVITNTVQLDHHVARMRYLTLQSCMRYVMPKAAVTYECIMKAHYGETNG